MARPKPAIILRDEQLYETIEILASPGIWFIAYQGRAIGITKRTWTQRGEVIKYPRTGFNNYAHALKLVKRLNERFMTDQFTVLEVK